MGVFQAHPQRTEKLARELAAPTRTMSNTASKTAPAPASFETALAELETIVKKLEEGDLALEQSLALYERGVQLSRFCHAQLEQAERRIEILNERGELKLAPASFAAEDPERG